MKLENTKNPNQANQVIAVGQSTASTDTNINNNNKLFNNLLQIQQQHQLEFILKELINQQQLQQFKLQIEQQLHNQLHQSILPSLDISNQASLNLTNTPDSAYPLARIEIDYSADTNLLLQSQIPNSSVYLINKKKITIGRKLNNLTQINKLNTPNTNSNNKLADILIENSTLVSRQHFSIELVSSQTRPNTSNLNLNNDFLYIDDYEEYEATDLTNNGHYWKLYCMSKNGMFINTRYVQTGKHIRLLSKKCSFRFPNTNIRIYFESMLHDDEPDQPVSENVEIVQVETTTVEKQSQEMRQMSVTNKGAQSNKIAQILLQKQLELQQNQLETNKNLIDDETSNMSNSSSSKSNHQSPTKLNNSTDLIPNMNSNESTKKPPFSYAQLIAQAICSSQEQQLTLSQIYSFISRKYSYYRLDDKGWQNSIRHNLSLNRNFVKVARQQNEPGKGSFWRIEPSSELKVIEQAYSRKSRSSTPNSVNRTQITIVNGANSSNPCSSLSPTSSSSSSSSLSQSPDLNLTNIATSSSLIKQNELSNGAIENDLEDDEVTSLSLNNNNKTVPIQLNQNLLVSLLQQNNLQVAQLSPQQIPMQQLNQLHTILNNNINVLNSNPGLVQLLYKNLTNLSSAQMQMKDQMVVNNNCDSNPVLLIQQQQPTVAQAKTVANNSVKLRLLLNDDSNITNSLKRSISQVLNDKDKVSYHNHNQNQNQNQNQNYLSSPTQLEKPKEASLDQSSIKKVCQEINDDLEKK